MIKVAALTSGKNVPSARFRVRQHLETLKQLGVETDEYIPIFDKNVMLSKWDKSLPAFSQKILRTGLIGAKVLTRLPGVLGSWTHQITWLQRELIPGRCLIEPMLKKPLVFDVDDSIWLAGASGASNKKSYSSRVSQAIAKIAKQSDTVVVGNSYLAQWFADYTDNIKIIPTAIDTERFKPANFKPNQRDDKFIVGWTGTSSNFRYLKAIEPSLQQFMTEFKDSELLIIADQPPPFTKLPSERVMYRPWSAQTENLGVQEMTVGLMPLKDDQWTRGKCSFKMLQYMACGLPVIVSPVGMNKDILDLGQLGVGIQQNNDWYDALRMFYLDRGLVQSYGRVGREVAEKYFSQAQIAKQLVEVFQELC